MSKATVAFGPRSGHLSLLAAVLVLLSGTAPVLAGEAQVRRGFWISFGGGYGSAQAHCDRCESAGREGSFTGTIRMGGTIGEHWLLGWEGSGWLKNNATVWLPGSAGADWELGTSGLTALYYPVPSSGFFVRAGTGVSFSGFQYGDCFDRSCYVFGSADGVGFGLTGGVGYDIRIARNKSLTPELTYVHGFSRDLSAGGITVATGWSHDFWALNLCLTFH